MDPAGEFAGPALATALLEQPILGIAVVDADLRCLRVNDAWTAATGRRPQVGERLFELLPDLRPLSEPQLNAPDVADSFSPGLVNLMLNGSPVFWTVAFQRVADGWAILLRDETEPTRTRLQLERQLADRTQKLSTLYEVMTATAEMADLRATLDWSLQRVLEAVQCPAGLLQLIDDFEEGVDPTGLRLVAHHGLTKETAAELANPPQHDPLTAQVIKAGRPVILTNPAALPSAAATLGTQVAVAMQVRERVVGILTVLASAGRRFGEIELALLDSVADQIGIVVENAYLHKQAEEAAVLAERHRLARELHDSVTQAIYSLTLFAEAGLRLIRSGNRDLAEECLLRLKETSQKALREMRLMLHKLRPLDLEEEGLIGALQQRLDEVEARANVEARLLVEGDLDDLPESVEEQLYRIAQEALNNALRHSNASLLTIRLKAVEDTVDLEISDNGRGFNVEVALAGGGMGLQNIEERVANLEGDLAIETAPGEGTTISVVVDLDEAAGESVQEPLF